MSEIEWKIEDNAPEPHVQIKVGDEWHWAGDSEVVALIRAAVEAERRAVTDILQKLRDEHDPPGERADIVAWDRFNEAITAIRARGEG